MHIIDAGTIFGFSPKEQRDLSLDGLLRSMARYGVERFLSLSLKGVLYQHEVDEHGYSGTIKEYAVAKIKPEWDKDE